MNILPFLGVSALIVAIAVIRAHCAKVRKAKEMVWSQINCPRCGSPFGEAAAKAAIDTILIDGDDYRLVEIHCPECFRHFDIGDGRRPGETFRIIKADKLFHTPEADLDAFCTLHVVWDFQMNVTREEVEARLRKVNPKLLARVTFVQE